MFSIVWIYLIYLNKFEIVSSPGTNRVTQTIKAAHEGSVFSLCTMKDGTILSGGGKDRKIKQWNANYTSAGKETEVSTLIYFKAIKTSFGNKTLTNFSPDSHSSMFIFFIYLSRVLIDDQCYRKYYKQ